MSQPEPYTCKHSCERDVLKNEIERLRAENARLVAGGCARDQTTTQFCAEAVALQAENARLREALEDIASGKHSNIILPTWPPQDPAVNAARKALKGD